MHRRYYYEILRTIFIPAATLVEVEHKKKASSSNDCTCKPSELPIYTRDLPVKPRIDVCSSQEPGAIEQTFGKIRKSIFGLIGQVKVVTQIGEEYFHEGLENAECLIDYLQEEENTTPKYGAVALGGLTGLIFGLRGKFFRRTLYASVGALGMAAICYPKEASQYSQIGIVEARRYATILYNFVYGVKKDDPPLELPSLPKLPGSLSEAWDAAKSLGKSSTSSVAEPPEEVEQVIFAEPDIASDATCNITETYTIPTDTSCECPTGQCTGSMEQAFPNEVQTSTEEEEGC